MANGDVTYVVLLNMGMLHLILKTKKNMTSITCKTQVTVVHKWQSITYIN